MNLGWFFRQNLCNPPKIPSKWMWGVLLVGCHRSGEHCNLSQWQSTWLFLDMRSFRFFFGGGLVGDELKPEMLFPLIFVWTWSMRCLVGCFCHKHLCFFARRIEMHMNHTGSLNSNSQWNFMVSILTTWRCLLFLLEDHDKTNHVREFPQNK